MDLISGDLEIDEKNSWRTDPEVFAALDAEFKFSMDAACSDKNTLVPNCYLTEQANAIEQNWSLIMDLKKCDNKNVWINPPYGRGMIKQFMYKAIEEKEKGVTTVMLVPATLDAQWLPINEVSEIRIVTGGRLSFFHPKTNKKVNGNTKGSMFVIFRPSKMPCVIRPIDRNELLGTNKVKEVA